MNWLDYYKNTFKQEFADINYLRINELDEAVLCAGYVKFFNSTCELLKLYLNYNGLFHFEKRDVVKEAFYVKIIEDGERWINALSLVEAYEDGEKEKFSKLFLSYLRDENFFIFNELNDKFIIFAEEYEQASTLV